MIKFLKKFVSYVISLIKRVTPGKNKSRENLIGPDTVVSPADGVIFGDFEGETVLFDRVKNKYHGFDTIYSSIWDLLDEPRSVSQLSDILSEKFELNREKFEKETLNFFNSLFKDNLLKIVDKEAELFLLGCIALVD